MKFIIIGLGNFGGSLAAHLTSIGHDVVGVDADMHKVERYKSEVTRTVCLDSTDEAAMLTLPLKEADYAIVAIGEDFGASVMATAILKKAGVRRLISRAINSLHHTVIDALEVDHILHPEQDAAAQFADSIAIEGLANSMNITDEFKVVEIKVPSRLVGYTIKDLNFIRKYSVLIITIIRSVETQTIFWKKTMVSKALGVLDAETRLEPNDRLVVFGKPEDISQLVSID